MISLLDFLFPKASLLGQEGEFVSAEELLGMQQSPVILERATLVSMKLDALDRIVGTARYGTVPLLKRAIMQWKYKRVPAITDALLIRLVALARELDLPSDACLVPVPLHWSRQFWRGFNQAKLLADGLSVRLQLRSRDLLRRTRPTGHQAWRTGQERRKAMHQAFRFTSSCIPEHVVLIDDVCTTGATLESCAEELKHSGVKTVEALVLAMG